MGGLQDFNIHGALAAFRDHLVTSVIESACRGFAQSLCLTSAGFSAGCGRSWNRQPSLLCYAEPQHPSPCTFTDSRAKQPVFPGVFMRCPGIP